MFDSKKSLNCLLKKSNAFICLMLSLFCVFSSDLMAQNTINNWYFGNNAALNFSSGLPVSLNNSAMSASEGCASISDDNGDLLFYTNGDNIWDGSHSIMSGGTGLNGSSMSAQSAIIVPIPKSSDLYLIFTVGDWLSSTPTGLSFTLVDMSQIGNGTIANPLGAVISVQKNILLDSEVAEQVTATYHSNCQDVWVIAHRGNQGFSSDEYIAFLVDSSGVQTTPVVSNAGMTYSGGNRFGYLRASNNGKKICSALGTGWPAFQGTTIEVLDFDNATGILSNPLIVADSGSVNSVYASEFSPDDSKLYATSYNGTHIYQFDLSSGVEAQVQASKTDISTGALVKSCVQIGPDKKIYVVNKQSAYLGVINNPNASGVSCSYIDQSVSLSNSNSGLGLPTFIKPLYSQTMSAYSACKGDTVFMAASFYQPGSSTTYLWQDSVTSHDNYATQSGQFWVSGFDGQCYYDDTFSVLIHDLPAPLAGSDTCVCEGASLQLGLDSVDGATYFWLPTGSTEAQPTVQPSAGQSYILNVLDSNGCTGLDSVFVCLNPLPEISAYNDTIIMQGTEATLLASGGTNYFWSSSIPINCPDCQQIQVSPDSSMLFYVFGEDSNGCTGTDSVLVSVEYFDTLYVPNAFSPNNDGYNEVLYVRTFGLFEEINFQLFNRWGKLVFQTNEATIGWDGVHNGVIQPMDAYVYYLTAKTVDGQIFTQKGDVTLIR